MASFEFLAIVLSVLGLAASITYYANILRNANKTQEMQLETRSQQLFMQIYQQASTPEVIRYWAEVIKYEWEDLEDFYSKYGAHANSDTYGKYSSIWRRYNTVGIMLRDKRISPALLYDYMGTAVLRMWNKFGSLIYKMREFEDNPGRMEWFEYFALEMDIVRVTRGISDKVVKIERE